MEATDAEQHPLYRSRHFRCRQYAFDASTEYLVSKSTSLRLLAFLPTNDSLENREVLMQ
jgi:hypothetical protein